MNESGPRIPAPRGPVDPGPVDDTRLIPLAELPAWHRPGVHRVRLSGRDVWVRMDGRGIASVSSIGPERLAALPLD